MAERKANLSDRLISVLSPGWAARRAISRLRYELATQNRAAVRRLSAFEAADKGRTSADWPTKNRSADGAIIRDQSILLARARQAILDDWSAKSIQGGHVRHIVGIGITPRANARHPLTNEPLLAFNQAADRWWGWWSTKKQYCDVQGQKRILDFQQLAVRELVAVGEAFIELGYQARPGMVGLVLQMFEPEQLDWSKATGIRSDVEVKNGIEVDEHGKIRAYWVYKGKHPYDSSSESERIPAERVIHLMRPDRVRQTHGVTWLHAVLREMWHTKMYEEYTLIRARMEACIGASIEEQPGLSLGVPAGLLTGDTGDEADANSNPQLNFEPGMIWNPGAGRKVNFHAPQVPGGQYAPYTQQQVKKEAAGAGLDYPVVSRDFSGNTYSGQRQGMLETNAETDPEQYRLRDDMMQPIWEAFVGWGIKEGKLVAPEFEMSPEWRQAYLSATWQAPPKPWIDPLNQAQAAESALKNRLTNRRDILNELGRDWRENFKQIQDEQTFAGELGLYLPDAQSPPRQGSTPGMNRKRETDHAVSE